MCSSDLPDWCLSSALAFPSDLGARLPCRGLRGWGCPSMYFYKDFPVAQTVKSLPAMQETQILSLGWEDPLEKGMAIHSSILAWRIP